MVYKKVVNNRLIIVELITSSKELLKKKTTFVRHIYPKKQADEVLSNIGSNLINVFIELKVVKEGRVIYTEFDFYSSNDVKELLEILIIKQKNMQNFEACVLLDSILDNI